MHIFFSPHLWKKYFVKEYDKELCIKKKNNSPVLDNNLPNITIDTFEAVNYKDADINRLLELYKNPQTIIDDYLCPHCNVRSSATEEIEITHTSNLLIIAMLLNLIKLLKIMKKF